MIEMITDPLFGAIDSTVCFVSDTIAGVTGVRCTRDTSGMLPVSQQAVRRQQVVAASQRQPAPVRAGFATNFIARG